MKHFQLKVLNNIRGKALKMLDEDGKPKSANLSDMLESFVFALPPQRLTMQDSIEARRLLESIASSEPGTLSIEEGTHDWLKKMVEAFAPVVFGVNAIVIKEAVDDFKRAKTEEAKAT